MADHLDNTSSITMATWNTPIQSHFPEVADEHGSSRLDDIVKPTKPTKQKRERWCIIVGVGFSEGWGST